MTGSLKFMTKNKGKGKSKDKEQLHKMHSSKEKLHIQWDELTINITAALRELRNDNDFTNVTLVSDDGQQVGVNNFVLISSSPFFKSLLTRNTSSQTLMYMRGVSSEHHITLVDFLYSGEANVDQESLGYILQNSS